MNLKFTAFLVLAAIAVGAVAYFNPFREDDDSGPKSPWFYQVAEEDILTISVSFEGSEVNFYKTEAETWAFEDPDGIPPSFTRWGGITLLLSGPQTRRDLTAIRPTIEDPAQYGLDTPNTIVKVGLSQDRVVEFRLGDPTADGDHHYGMVVGFEELFTIANTWGEVIARLAHEPPLPKWYEQRDIESIVEINVYDGDPSSENTAVLQFSRNRTDGEWSVHHRGVDDEPRPIDPDRWAEIRPLIAGPKGMSVVVPKVDDSDYSPWGIVDDSKAVEIRFSGLTDRGTRYTDGVLLIIGDRLPDGSGYYGKSESSFVREPVLFLNKEWTETILGLLDDIPYADVPDETASN